MLNSYLWRSSVSVSRNSPQGPEVSHHRASAQNNYHWQSEYLLDAVVLTPTIIKCFERMLLIFPASLDSHQFANRANSCTGCHLPGSSHCPDSPGQQGTNVGVLFLDYGSVVNSHPHRAHLHTSPVMAQLTTVQLDPEPPVKASSDSETAPPPSIGTPQGNALSQHLPITPR